MSLLCEEDTTRCGRAVGIGESQRSPELCRVPALCRDCRWVLRKDLHRDLADCAHSSEEAAEAQREGPGLRAGRGLARGAVWAPRREAWLCPTRALQGSVAAISHLPQQHGSQQYLGPGPPLPLRGGRGRRRPGGGSVVGLSCHCVPHGARFEPGRQDL